MKAEHAAILQSVLLTVYSGLPGWTADHSCVNNHKTRDFGAEEGTAGNMNRETWEQLAELFQVCPSAAPCLQDPFI